MKKPQQKSKPKNQTESISPPSFDDVLRVMLSTPPAHQSKNPESKKVRPIR